MWSTDKEKFHLTKRMKRENSFVCGFKSKDIDIVITKFGEKEKFDYYDHNYKADISWAVATSEYNFKSTCFGNNFVDLIEKISIKIDTIFGDNDLYGSLYKRPDNIDQNLLSVLINKDIIMAFNKGECNV